MAKYRPAGSKKTKAPAPTRGLIPCAIIVLLGFGVIYLLFYLLLESGQ
jgi:hypothetical protein